MLIAHRETVVHTLDQRAVALFALEEPVFSQLLLGVVAAGDQHALDRSTPVPRQRRIGDRQKPPSGETCQSPFAQLVAAIESGVPPESDADAALGGVEVLMAAYRSCEEGGASIALPLDDGANPLIAASQQATASPGFRRW